jgi:uncharacterized protein YprB with RNaseH-like and TPR domain
MEKIMKILFYDLETTGLTVQENAIIQLRGYHGGT